MDSTKKPEIIDSKSKLHPRNKHRDHYKFTELITAHPELENYVSTNKFNKESIDFFDPKAVKALNKALLFHFYKLEYWNIPEGYLCPPIPGRADYIHYIADLLGTLNNKKIPRGKNITALDIGVGANCIYPILGQAEYHWSFIGADIDEKAINNANKIISSNPVLKNKIDLRLQLNKECFFQGILQKDEVFDVSICNPPFHSSSKEAQTGSLRKLKNLKNQKSEKLTLNFSGQHNELWCNGGELRFIKQMIKESQSFSFSCFWFTTLVAKQVHLKEIYRTLKKTGVAEYRTIPMGQGNKSSRIVAWTFLTKKQQKIWKESRWT